MYSNLDYNVPPVASSRWKILTQPLLELIEKGDRSIAEIIGWGKERNHSGSLTRHMLAWLSYNNLVYYVAPNAVWRVGAEPAGIAEIWDSLDRKSSKSRRLLESLPEGEKDRPDTPEDPQIRPIESR